LRLFASVANASASTSTIAGQMFALRERRRHRRVAKDLCHGSHYVARGRRRY
jgi:hypothetical protein